MDGWGWAAGAGWGQDLRSKWWQVEARTGRRYSAEAQKFLHRVVYVPHHNDEVSHLPLYNLSERFWETINDTPVGSSMFTVKLHAMQKPTGDGTDQIEVEYLVDFDKSTGDEQIPVFANVQRRKGSAPQPDDEVQLKVSTSKEEACHLTFRSPFGTTDEVTVPMTISYPFPALKTKLGLIDYPYFTFQVPDVFGPTTFEWRADPKRGPLRYSLYLLPPPELASGSEEPQQEEPQPILRAIYHHNGLGISLSQGHSEGVLLLPTQNPDSKLNHPEWEGVVIASLLGLLWRLRNMNGSQGMPKSGRRSSKGDIAPTYKTTTRKTGGFLRKLRRNSSEKNHVS